MVLEGDLEFEMSKNIGVGIYAEKTKMGQIKFETYSSKRQNPASKIFNERTSKSRRKPNLD